MAQRSILQIRTHLAILTLTTLANACASAPVGMLAPKYSSAWSKCGEMTKVKVKAPQSTLTISYSEPTTGTDGKPLTNLARTTIYVDAGDGPMIAKLVPATKPTGGGKITEQITLSVRDPEKEVALCITATDTDDREGPASS